MNIQESQIKKIRLTELDALDPVTVFIEDHEPGKGEITFKCYGQSWSAYWGGMSGMTVMEFFLSCDDHYLAKNFWDHSKEKTEIDDNKLTQIIRKLVLSKRRDKSLDNEFAREMFDVGDWTEYMPQHTYDEWTCPSIFVCEAEFKEFAKFELNYIDIPERNSSEYDYLLRIIAAIRAAFAKLTTPTNSKMELIA